MQRERERELENDCMMKIKEKRVGLYGNISKKKKTQSARQCRNARKGVVEDAERGRGLKIKLSTVLSN